MEVDARQLPRIISENLLYEAKIPSSIKFDRIDVSNILDANYVGLHDVLTLWSPLLGESKSAVIVGYFMNWSMLQNGGRVTSAGESVAKGLMRRAIEKEKVRLKNTIFPKKGSISL